MIHCPSCGAGLRFDIEMQKMVCDHCDGNYNVEDICDQTKNDAKAAEMFDTYIYVCPDCGAELASTEKNDMIGFCPYCGGAHMLYDRVRENWKPDYVVPFKVTKEQCKEAYIKEVKRHPFVSSGYRKPELIESFRGIYMPFWYYEGKQSGRYYVREKQKVKRHSKETRDYAQYYTADYKVKGYSHDASLSFDDHISEKLAPYTYEEKRCFHPAYLSGFYAEIGDADKEEYRDVAMARMQEYTYEEIAMLGGKEVDLDTEVESLDCALHPVWFMSYRKKNRLTYAAVNGETGKVAADLPLSPLRILLAMLLASAAVFGLLRLLMPLLPSVTAHTTMTVCSMIMTGGMYFLLTSYLNTVIQSLRLQFSKPLQPWLFSINMALAILGYILAATDGSYSQLRRFFGVLILVPSLIAIVVIGIEKPLGVFSELKIRLRKATCSQLENGIIDAAQKYNSRFKLMYLACYGVVLFCLISGIWADLSKTLCYVLCGVMGLYLLVTALLHIRFQTTVAKRRPPQMDKKGALYDEK